MAHQKGGLGKSTSAALLSGEIADRVSSGVVVVEDPDVYRHVSLRAGQPTRYRCVWWRTTWRACALRWR